MNKTLKYILITLGLSGAGYLLYKKYSDFKETLNVSIGSFSLSAKSVLSNLITAKVLTYVDVNGGITPRIQGLSVRVFAKNGNEFTQIGVSKPLTQDIPLKIGRNSVNTEIEVNAIGLLNSILGKEITYRVETIVISPLATIKEVEDFNYKFSLTNNPVFSLFQKKLNKKIV